MKPATVSARRDGSSRWVASGSFTRAILTAVAIVLGGCGNSEQSTDVVVVYTSVDDVFARPIAEKFTALTGICVKLVPDTEETKSTGLLNRLIAERKRPVADVFWSGDPMRAAVLKAHGISASYRSPKAAGMPTQFSDPEGHWSALSARARVLIYNKNMIKDGDEPKSVQDLVQRFKGKACLANPMFGTTSMHAAALFEIMGEANATKFFDGLLANEVKMLSSNGEVRRRVAAGDFAFGLTDTDDASVAIKEGKPVGVVYPDQDGPGALIIPNAAVLIAGGPNPAAGKQFIDYLLSAEVEEALAKSEAAQMPLRPGVPVPDGVKLVGDLQAMVVDYTKLAERHEELAKNFLKAWVDKNNQQ